MVIQLSLSAAKDRSGHGFGVVPPEFLGNAAEPSESFHAAVKNRFDLLTGKRDGKREVGIGPSDDQHCHLATTVRKVDIDVTKVRFGPLSRIMRKRDKRLAIASPFPGHVTPNLIVATLVAVLGQASEDRHGSMTLLTRSRFILLQNRFNTLLKRKRELDCGVSLRACIASRFRVLQNLSNLASRMTKCTSNLANAHAIPMGSANSCVIFHL